ncbi:MAG: stage III sporulation protein AF, partial [Firmicutes bacterium]|nr:stage III sporulation protein AF [Bacillota bacterium]
MERLLQIVCGLILLLLLYSLLDMLLPAGGIARFVRLVMGLALLAVAVAPLSRLPALVE